MDEFDKPLPVEECERMALDFERALRDCWRAYLIAAGRDPKQIDDVWIHQVGNLLRREISMYLYDP